MNKENQNIEWKRFWRDDYIKWICGFANADGGVIDIGRDDSGNVVGVDNAERLLEDIPNKIRDILGIMVDVNLKSENSLNFIEIVIEPYPYPISYKGEYHYRSGSTKQLLKGAALDRFLLKKQGVHWDSIPVMHAQDSELGSLDHFRKLALKSGRLSESTINESDTELLNKLRLYDKESLKRAAILLFHPDPEKYITGAFVKIAFWESECEILYQNEVHGTLFEQVDQVLDLLLTKYMKAIISYEGIVRIEKYPIPEKALREAILNAIAHKDYGSGVPIQISVYEDKIMIWNNGQLFSDWTTSDLYKKHCSQPYNPDIANAFFRAGLIEAWGRGIEKMCNACKKHGSATPIINSDKGGLWITFPFKPISSPIGSPISSPKTEDCILELIKTNPKISTSVIGTSLNISKRAVLKQISKLKEQGRLKRIGSAKGGYWEIMSK